MSKLKPVIVIVTQAYLDHPDEVGTYFRVGDRIHIDARHRNYFVERDGKPYGGVGAGGVPLEHGACDPEWVATSLAYGGFVYEDEELPPVAESNIYFNLTGRRKATLELSSSRELVALGVTGTALKVRLSPETAKVMAHDLYRLARLIEKEQAE